MPSSQFQTQFFLLLLETWQGISVLKDSCLVFGTQLILELLSVLLILLNDCWLKRLQDQTCSRTKFTHPTHCLKVWLLPLISRSLELNNDAPDWSVMVATKDHLPFLRGLNTCFWFVPSSLKPIEKKNWLNHKSLQQPTVLVHRPPG